MKTFLLVLSTLVVPIALVFISSSAAGDSEHNEDGIVVINDIGHNPSPGVPNPGGGTNPCGRVFTCYHRVPTNAGFRPPGVGIYGVATVYLGPTNAMVPLASTNYDLYWLAGGTNRGCASNVTNRPYQKAWRVRTNRTHLMTVYHLGTNCPTNGVTLRIDWTNGPVIFSDGADQ